MKTRLALEVLHLHKAFSKQEMVPRSWRALWTPAKITSLHQTKFLAQSMKTQRTITTTPSLCNSCQAPRFKLPWKIQALQSLEELLMVSVPQAPPTQDRLTKVSRTRLQFKSKFSNSRNNKWATWKPSCKELRTISSVATLPHLWPL